MLDRVGKALVSTWLSASVIQYSTVNGGKSDVESVAKRRGILLMRKDLRMVVACCFSFRNVALARTSNVPRIRSMIVD